MTAGRILSKIIDSGRDGSNVVGSIGVCGVDICSVGVEVRGCIVGRRTDCVDIARWFFRMDPRDQQHLLGNGSRREFSKGVAKKEGMTLGRLVSGADD